MSNDTTNRVDRAPDRRRANLPHSSGWYGPSGALGVVLLIVLILFLLGRI